MRRICTFALAACAAFALAACAGAPASTAEQAPAAAPVGALTMNDPWVRPVDPAAPAATPMPNATAGAMGGQMEMAATANTAGYMTIVNSGAAADFLVAATASTDLVDAVELHTVTEEDGMMKMRPVEKIEVPANGEVALKPGGFHIMFIGVKHELKPGDVVKLSLTFEKAGTVEVDAVVRPAMPMP